MTRTRLALSCSALLLCAAQASSADEAAPGALTATLVEGVVTAAPPGGEPAPLAEGAALHEGETVRTSAGARVEIATANGSVIRLGESAQLLLATAPASGHAFSARLLLGSLWTHVHKLLGGETFHVETENGVAGVRGTEFFVEAGPQQDVVRVYEGAVEVAGSSGWSHRVEPGQELSFRRDRAPAGPRRFDPAQAQAGKLMRWVREQPPKGRAAHGGAERERPQLERKERRRDRDERNERAHEHRGLRR